MNKIQRERRAARRWAAVKQLIWWAILCLIVLSVVRVFEWAVPRPPVMILVCIEDKDGPRNCKKYKTLEELSSD